MRRLALLLVLAACGPIPVSQAEDQCIETARLAKAPRGEIGIGVSSGGPSVSGGITVSSDYLRGRDPSAVYDACVVQKSGQLPNRPLAAHPRWNG
jgi:hypothetical protein